MPMIEKSEMLYLRDKIDEQGQLIYEIHGTVKAINQNVKNQNGRIKKTEKKLERQVIKIDDAQSSIDKAQGAIEGLKVVGVLITIILGLIATLTYFKPI